MKLAAIICAAMFLSGIFVTTSQSQLARQWVARYTTSLKGGLDGGTAITTDDSGYVYVTGFISKKGGGSDVVTIKYSSLGAQRWVATFTGSVPAKGKGIAVDSAGNVYVVASSGTGSSANYLTIKYNSGGVQQWTAFYNGPASGEDQPVAIAVNDSMNVFVTGYSAGTGTGFDYATVKYNAAGTQIWANRFDGLAHGDDRAYGIVLYGLTAVYVTGAITDTALDFKTIKYDAHTGDTLWTVQYNGPANGNDIAKSIALHGSSDVYVTGGSRGVGTGWDYATLRISSAGVVEWVSRFNGDSNGDDFPVAVGYGSEPFVTGRSLETGSFNDIVTLGLNNSDGSIDWSESINGSANDNDSAVALIPSGSSVYVLGVESNAGVGMDYVLQKYRGSNGQKQGTTIYNGVGNWDDVPFAVASSGSVFVTGSSYGVKSGADMLTIGFIDPNNISYRTFNQTDLVGKGATLKDNSTVPNLANLRDAAFAIMYPKIKSGYPGAPGGMLLGNVRRDSASSYGWIRVAKGASISGMVPQTGPKTYYNFTGEKKSLSVSKYNNQLLGDLIALKMNIATSDAEVTPPTLGELTYNDNDTSNHYNGVTLRQLAALVDNVLTYGGHYTGVNYTSLDTMMAKVNNAFRGPLGMVNNFIPVAAGVNPVDSVAFLSNGPAPLLDPLAFQKGMVEHIGKPVQYALYQNYPNPFNPSTTIEFTLAKASRVTLKIYDLLGREVATLFDNDQLEGGKQEIRFDASNFASGIYLYRITANDGEFQMVKRMVLVR